VKFLFYFKSLFKLSVIEILYRFTNYIIFYLILKSYSVNLVGEILYGQQLLAILVVFTNFGFDLFSTTEIQKGRYNVIYYNIQLKFLITFSLIFTNIMIHSFINFSVSSYLITIFYSLSLLPLSLNTTWYSYIRHDVRNITYSRIIESACYFILALFIIKNASAFFIPIAFFLSTLLASFFLFKKNNLQFNNLFFLSKNKLQQLIYGSLPYGISLGLIAIYLNVDVIMLRYIRSDYAVGLYSIPLKLYLIAQIPFPILMSFFFPINVKNSIAHHYSIKSFTVFYFLSLGVGLLSAIVLFNFVNDIIHLLNLGSYSSSIVAIQLLAIGIVVKSLNIVIGNSLLSYDYKIFFAAASFLGLLINFILNFLFIPRFSYNGAAFTTMLTEVIIFFIFLTKLKNVHLS
jgi:O-antigen/teichoic acid export membrane protein